MGYSPLPPHLSQEIVNSIGRMNGTAPPRRLNAQNCPGNPRFRGSLGGGAASPEDPLEDIPEQNGGGGGGGGAGGNGSGGGVGGGNGGGTDTSAGSGTTATSEPSAGAGRDGGADAVGGGSGDWRDAEPTSYDGDRPEPLDRAPLVILLGMLACPPLFTTLWRRLHERPTPGSPPPPAPPPDPRAAPSG